MKKHFLILTILIIFLPELAAARLPCYPVEKMEEAMFVVVGEVIDIVYTGSRRGYKEYITKIRIDKIRFGNNAKVYLYYEDAKKDLDGLKRQNHVMVKFSKQDADIIGHPDANFRMGEVVKVYLERSNKSGIYSTQRGHCGKKLIKNAPDIILLKEVLTNSKLIKIVFFPGILIFCISLILIIFCRGAESVLWIINLLIAVFITLHPGWYFRIIGLCVISLVPTLLWWIIARSMKSFWPSYPWRKYDWLYIISIFMIIFAIILELFIEYVDMGRYA